MNVRFRCGSDARPALASVAHRRSLRLTELAFPSAALFASVGLAGTVSWEDASVKLAQAFHVRLCDRPSDEEPDCPIFARCATRAERLLQFAVRERLLSLLLTYTPEHQATHPLSGPATGARKEVLRPAGRKTGHR